MQIANPVWVASVTCLTALCIAAPAATQNPQFAEVGELIPDGFGQVIGTADYEGDGDDDLFATSGVYLNENGFFRPGPTWPAGFDPGINVRSAEIADFDGDGRVDLMISRLGGAPSGVVLLLAPIGAGTTFGIGQALPGLTQQPWEMTAADFDGDSDVDLLVGNTSLPSTWQLHLNNGAGTFTPATAAQWPPGASANIYWVGRGDFDGDGWVDAVAGDAGGVFWRRNLGGGSFGATQSLAGSLPIDGAVVGDFDGDGYDDVFAVEWSGQEATYSGSATGLTAATSSFGGILGAPPLAADRDGDGRDELLRSVTQVSGSLTGELFVRPGQASGPGPAVSLGAIRFAFSNVGPYPGIAVLDVDSDGDRDTVIAPGGMTPRVLLRTPVGDVVAAKSTPAGFIAPFAPPRDIDGDGFVDLLQATLASGVITLQAYRNDGRGYFTDPPVFAGSYSGFATKEPTWADLDGDGDLDLWTDSPHSSLVNVALLNNGAGVFSASDTVGGVGPATATVVADFTGDQLPDIVVARPVLVPFPYTPQAPLFIPGAPAPAGVAFGLPQQFGTATFIADMLAIDAELDGDLDLLVATATSVSGPSIVYFYENDGFGTFTAQPPFPGVLATKLATGDLNGDQLADLVLGDQTWLRTGTTFSFQGVHATPLGDISLADVNEDGAADLLDTAGQWSAGDGAGNFGAPVAFTPYGPQAFGASRGGRISADLDGDGDLDTIGPCATRPGHFAIYSNLERHAAATSLATAGNPIGLAVYGEAGSPWFLGVSLPTTGFIGFPFGPLFLDPNSLFVVGGGLIPATGRVNTSAVIPANGAGFTLTWQALVGQPLRFTNAFDTPIAF